MKYQKNKEKYQISEENKFLNPYNFISVNWGKTDRSNVSAIQDNLLEGVIKCHVIVKTPLSIPDTENVEYEDIDGKKHVKFKFMRDDNNNLMIPGSSLRGAIRSVYETVTDSCFVTFKDMVITKRAGMQESGKPYILKKEDKGWKAYEAERYLVIIDDKTYRSFENDSFPDTKYKKYTLAEIQKYKNGQKVFFEAGEEYISKKTNKKEQHIGKVVKRFSDKKESQLSKDGYFYKGEVPPLKNGRSQTNKHFSSIFSLKKDACPIDVSDNDVDALKYIYDCYNDEAINNNLSKAGDYYKGYKELLNGNGPIPVWYNKDTKKFSLASIGRIAYLKTLKTFMADKIPCSDRNNLCPACVLFGSGNEDGKVASKIRITDAICTDKSVELKENKTLHELGSPRLSYIPFYTKNSNNQMEFWDYDSKNTELLGRKYYWHSNKPIEENIAKTNRNATVDLAPENTCFDFDIFFDGITKHQLKELKWILTFGENKAENSRLFYKLGHGKPLGLGSCKIIITEVRCRQFNAGDYKISVERDPDVSKPDNLKHSEELMHIVNFDTTKDINVSYPFVVNAKENDNNTAPHQWFSFNWDKRNAQNNQKFNSVREIKGEKDGLLAAIELSNEETTYKKNDQKRRNGHFNCGGGVIEEVTVTGMNKKGTFVNFTFIDGSNGSAYANGETYQKNTKLSVEKITFNETFKKYDCKLVLKAMKE